MSDDEGVEAFCRRVRPQLVGVLSLQVGSAAVAEELAQETLARVWDRWPRVRTLESPEGWAHRVAVNLARSWWRRRRAEQRAYRRQAAGQRTTVTDSDEVDGEEVQRAVARLPRRQREALALTAVAGYSTAEAGEMMRCAPGTVKALCAQARQRLRAEVEDERGGRAAGDAGPEGDDG